jgi:autophagy-related protein 2
LSLKEGSISAVKARIPWPNPLASIVGLTLTSAHLVFHVISPKDHMPKPRAGFAESVTSVADSFMQEDLSSIEEDAHWRSIYQETVPHSSVHEINPIPGAMDVPQKMDNHLCRPDNDPVGVSVFASLIENLLARFEFDAHDIKISLVHEDNICLTLSLQEMRYQTDTKANSRTASSTHAAERECRTLSFVGISLSATHLGAMNRRVTSRRLNPVGGSPQTGTLNALSRVSSNSSLDEETRSAMSRSLAVLPPRLDSPVDSVTSSMYMSALSLESGRNEDPIQNPVRSRSSTPASDPPQSTSTWQNREEKMISFGSQPVTAKLTTPSPTHAGSADDPFLSPEDAETSSAEELRIEISMSVVACVIQPWQIAGLLRLSEALVPRESQCTDSRFKAMDKLELPSIKVTLCARGLVLLLDSTFLAKNTSFVDMADYFERPLVPPELERGYTRIYFDTLVGSVKVGTTSTGEKVLESTTRVNVNLADLSILSFAPDQTPSNLKAFPLVITDRYLPAQYPNQHLHPESGTAYPTLPTIDFTNWTDGRNHHAGGKLSHWRSRSAKLELGTLNTGIQFRGSRTVTSIEGKYRVFDEMDIQIAPLHVRLDLATLVHSGGILSFFDEFLSLETNTDDDRSDVSDDTVDDSPPVQRTGISDVFESPFSEPVYDHTALGRKKSPDPEAGLVRHTLVDTAASQCYFLYRMIEYHV